jgi:hypothetical protein
MKCENETFKKNVIITVSRGIDHLAYIYIYNYYGIFTDRNITQNGCYF